VLKRRAKKNRRIRQARPQASNSLLIFKKPSITNRTLSKKETSTAPHVSYSERTIRHERMFVTAEASENHVEKSFMKLSAERRKTSSCRV
jgi:hypothetical protein